ncbi:MAG: hypothetical protein JST05_09705 [Acidobacteria bacterium]|nr:hypothetical protein [Acidobacteriota bacterium]
MNSNLHPSKEIVETDPKFLEFRQQLLQEADRLIFLAIDNYARGMEALRASSSTWSFVSFYYASMYAAKAILALHGCWFQGNGSWLQAENLNQGSQSFKYYNTRPNMYTRIHSVSASGSHQIFWSAYYAAAGRLAIYYEPQHTKAVRPNAGDEHWQIRVRNDLNYHPISAFRLIDDFSRRFAASPTPMNLPSELATIIEMVEAMLDLLKFNVSDFNFGTQIYIPSSFFGVRDRSLQQLGVQHPALTAHVGGRLPGYCF